MALSKSLLRLCILGITLTLSGVLNTAWSRDQIRIVGSSTVYPFATSVAERVGRTRHIKTPIVESTGTGGGMRIFCDGLGPQTPDIVNASRKMKASERTLCESHAVGELAEIPIGSDGIAFANSVRAEQYNFTKQQLWQALAAKGSLPKRWSEIDPSLPNTKIEVFVPPPTSGTRDSWNELVMQAGCSSELKATDKKSCLLLREDGVVVESGENDALLVQKLTASPEAFGIFGFSYLDNNRDRIQAMTINSSKISLESIQSGAYPLSRTLYIYVKQAHISIVPGISEFITELTSTAALGEDGYLAELGLVPLEESRLTEIRNKTKAFLRQESSLASN